MTDEVFKIEGGEKSYDSYYSAETVAEAKAEEEGESVKIYRKLLNTFEPVMEIHPDGEKEELE
ncbi:MAG: hypothetical protein ABEJ62_00975 [Candidatus Nanohaloarchaea archaeon]